MATTPRNQAEVFTLEDVQQVLREMSGEEADAVTAPVGWTPSPKKLCPETKAVERKPASVSDILGFDPHSTSSNVQPNGRDAVPAKWHQHFDALVKMREELLRRLQRHTAETLQQGDGEEQNIASVLDQRGVDEAAEQVDLGRAMSSVENEQELLCEVEAALGRLYQGTYGICAQTGKPIEAERLAVLPFARHSLHGQEEYERNSHSAKENNRKGPLFAPGDDEEEDSLTAEDGIPEE